MRKHPSNGCFWRKAVIQQKGAALAIVENLMGGGLPYIQDRLALQMVRPEAQHCIKRARSGSADETGIPTAGAARFAAVRSDSFRRIRTKRLIRSSGSARNYWKRRGRRGNSMDKDHIPTLVQLGSTKQGVQKIKGLAEKVMQQNGYGFTLHNACAATLSEFMNSSDVDVPITLGAGNLARRIKSRGWNQVNVANQQAGDVAVAVNDVHIFLVVQAIDKDPMIIADNQAPGP